MLDLYHEIAGITFRTKSNLNIPRINEKLFEPYLCSKRNKPEITQNIIKTRHPCKEAIALRKILYDQQKQKEIKLVKVDDFLRIFNFSSNKLYLLFNNNEINYKNSPQRSEHFVAANLRIIFSSFLTSFSSIMIHCSGLIMKNRAAIFLAPDYGGKTTLVSLAKGRYPILNDDQVIIKNENGIIYAHATPFGAQNSGPLRARLAGFFMLKKSSSFKIEPLSPLDIIECIWGEHLRYTHFLPTKNKQAAFNILYDALLQAPSYNLHFNKNYVNWDLIQETLALKTTPQYKNGEHCGQVQAARY